MKAARAARCAVVGRAERGTGVGVAATSGIVTAGAASVLYTLPAGTTVGVYTITATYNPAPVNPQFTTSTDSTHTLTVMAATPAFTGLSTPTETYGSTSVTLGGTITGGVPAGETVNITLSGVTKPATIGAAGAFSANFDPHTLTVAGGPYTITYAYGGDANFNPLSDASKTLTVQRAKRH